MLALILMIGPLNLTITHPGVYTFLFTLALSFVSKETRLNQEKLVRFLHSAGRGCCTVATACSVAGIIIGTVTGTGLSCRLSSILVEAAGGRLEFLLVITMSAAIIHGMGLPGSACYLVLAALVAPAMIRYVTNSCLTGTTQFSLKSTGARELSGLRGKRIGVASGAMANYYWKYLLEACGMTESDFGKVEVMGIKDLLVAIQDGTLTAAHPQAGEVGRKVLENRLLPFHPGAERYYNEIGLAQ